MKLYISRTETPDKAAEDPITLTEWLALVRDTPEIRLYEGEQAIPHHIVPPQPSDGLARWTNHPAARVVWFDHRDGVIVTDSYDAYIATRMRALANRLHARVMDENGRYF